MTPTFALLLSVDKITLLHRADQGWLRVGDVRTDEPDLDDALQRLRRRANKLGDDTRCKVVIPNDQIRYLTVDTNSLSETDRQAKIESELESATPYRLDDLKYDIAEREADAQIAAVAKVTLLEAETFAREYGFQPVSYVALPEPGAFPKEPYFGATPGMDEIVEPDEERIEIVGEADFSASEDLQPALAFDTLAQAEDNPAHSEKTAAKPVEEQPSSIDFSSCRRPTLDDTNEEDVEASPVNPKTNLHPEVPPPPPPAIHPIADPAPASAFQAPAALGRSPLDEAERLTIFGARNRAPNHRRMAIPVFAASFIAVLALAGWFVLRPNTDPVSQPDEPRAEQVPPERISLAEPDEQPGTTITPDIPDTAGTPVLSVTDNAVLDALRVEPRTVEEVDTDPEGEEVLYAATGIWSDAPLPPQDPELDTSLDDLYVASIDPADLSQDALALPDASSFETDQPPGQAGLPGTAGATFELDSRGLVTATPEGALNPDGVIVYLGRPAQVPPPPPERAEPEPEIDEAQVVLAGFRPKLRPESLVEDNERLQLGGRSVEELAGLRPRSRPESLQADPMIDETPTALAVVVALKPKLRPKVPAANTASVPSAANGSLGTTAGQGNAATSDEAGSFAAKSVKPKIPSSASVARQATLDNALNLRRVNLIGVYGTPANRRALIRLPSGRYKKVKVGDRVDGGKVVAIGDSELHYQKNGRKVTLGMPKG